MFFHVRNDFYFGWGFWLGFCCWLLVARARALAAAAAARFDDGHPQRAAASAQLPFTAAAGQSAARATGSAATRARRRNTQHNTNALELLERLDVERVQLLQLHALDAHLLDQLGEHARVALDRRPRLALARHGLFFCVCVLRWLMKVAMLFCLRASSALGLRAVRSGVEPTFESMRSQARSLLVPGAREQCFFFAARVRAQFFLHAPPP